MGFSFRRSITVDHTKVPNTDQTDFAVLVAGTYTYLKTYANGGKVMSASGYDIGFYSDSALTTPLNWEVESYAAASGAVVYWVKLASVSHTSDTVFYMAYGDSSVVGDLSHGTLAWDSSYQGVWHLPNLFGIISAADSTSNGKNGTLHATPTAVTAQIGGGVAFVGASSQYISFPTLPALSNVSAFSMEMWAKSAGMIGQGSGSALAHLTWDGAGTIYCFFDSVATNFASVAFSEATAFHHIALVYDGSLSAANRAKLYVDGVLQTLTITGTIPASIAADSSAFEVGRDVANGIYTTGSLDEIRISSATRSADWITSEYNNQSSPSGFYTLGSEIELVVTVDKWHPRTEQPYVPRPVINSY